MANKAEARKLALEALLNPPPTSLFAEPIDFIFAEHFRQRTLCSILVQIAEADTKDHELIAAALHFIETDFGRHVLDEEEDLFPLVRLRAEPDDNIEQVLAKLSEEHAADEADVVEIRGELTALAKAPQDIGVDPQLSQLLIRFAANERQHLIVENAIVLPLAKARLTEEDCRKLGTRMAARRGMEL